MSKPKKIKVSKSLWFACFIREVGLTLINYNLSMKELLGKYRGGKNRKLKYLLTSRQGKVKSDLVIVRFDRPTKYESVLRYLAMLDLESADSYELLTAGKNLNLKGQILLAAGQFEVGSNGDKDAPSLDYTNGTVTSFTTMPHDYVGNRPEYDNISFLARKKRYHRGWKRIASEFNLEDKGRWVQVFPHR